MWQQVTFKTHHDDVIKWKHFPRNWPFVREIHRSPVNFPYKGQWRGALMFSLIYAWINDLVNNREAGDLRRQHGHYDVIVMILIVHVSITKKLERRNRLSDIKVWISRISKNLHTYPSSNVTMFYAICITHVYVYNGIWLCMCHIKEKNANI